MVGLQEQPAEIAQTIAQTMSSAEMKRAVSQIQALTAKQLAEAGALKGAVQGTSAFADLAKMAGATEQIRQLVATPGFQRFVEQQHKTQR